MTSRNSEVDLNNICLKLLTGDTDEMTELQRVFEEAPDYALCVTGHSPTPADAQSAYTSLPPDKGYEDKFVFGIYLGGRMIGCVDLIRAYPDKKTAMLGLLLLSEKVQGKGHGKAAFRKIEEILKNWGGIDKIRIGVVATNDCVLEFWKKMGFLDTGIRKPYRHGELESENFVYEKPIVSNKHRYTMRITLQRQLEQNIWPTRKMTVKDSEAIGVLMERAYRGTIDDEGETLNQFIGETRATIEGKYGPYVADTSFWIERDGKAVSATMVTLWKEKPLLAFSVTDPDYQGQGLATYLIQKTMNAVMDLGYTQLDLGVTQGNTSAERLYRKLGFEAVP